MITIDGGTGIILHNGIEIASDKMHDQWRLNADESHTNGVLTGWVRPTESGSGAYLTGMSHSSGVFTFPKTGIYRVDFKAGFMKGNDIRYAGTIVKLSTDSGSSYGDLTRSYATIKAIDSATTYTTSIANMHVDVTNATTFRIRFEIAANTAVSVYGTDDDTRTTVTFNRIANT